MSNSPLQEPPMKWHKFLIYFGLWASALIEVVNGVQLLNGSIYEGQADAVYQYYAGLESADKIFGILMIAIGAFGIYTRFQLAGFKKGAPGKLVMNYILGSIVPAGYLLVVSGIAKVSINEVASPAITSTIVSCIVFTFICRTYYGKRAHLFGEAPVSGGNSPLTTGVKPEQHETQQSSQQPLQQPLQQSPYPPQQYAQPPRNTPPANRTKFCTQCGAKADPSDKWCTHCGAKLD